VPEVGFTSTRRPLKLTGNGLVPAQLEADLEGLLQRGLALRQRRQDTQRLLEPIRAPLTEAWQNVGADLGRGIGRYLASGMIFIQSTTAPATREPGFLQLARE